jgi:hypothetical protein
MTTSAAWIRWLALDGLAFAGARYVCRARYVCLECLIVASPDSNQYTACPQRGDRHDRQIARVCLISGILAIRVLSPCSPDPGSPQIVYAAVSRQA